MYIIQPKSGFEIRDLFRVPPEPFSHTHRDTGIPYEHGNWGETSSGFESTK